MPASIAGGAWYHLGTFDAQRLTADGASLADPAGSGEPAQLRRNRGIFGVYEQMLWRSPLAPDKGIGFFLRTSVSPSDRNLISFYLDGGVQVSGFCDARPNDKFGIAATYAKISDAARAFDRDAQLYHRHRHPGARLRGHL